MLRGVDGPDRPGRRFRCREHLTSTGWKSTTTARCWSLSGAGASGRLVVHVHRPDDAGCVAACKSVERLELSDWKATDLAALRGLPVTHLRLIRGQQTSVKGLDTSRLKQVWLHGCGKVRELQIPRLPWLWHWACNNFDLDTLASVRGLVGLDIGPRREIRSLASVASCRSLKCLFIDTNSWKTSDFRPLARAPALELVGFTRLRRVHAEALSQANPKLVTGAGANCYLKAGQRVDEAVYLKRGRVQQEVWLGAVAAARTDRGVARTTVKTVSLVLAGASGD